jgi:hypothetical protein
VSISQESVERLISQNLKLSNAAEALGDAHKDANRTIAEMASTNATLAKQLVEICKESHRQKACTPARNVRDGGGSASKTA